MIPDDVMIKEWLEQENNSSHMLVVCDTFDYDYYPVYISVNTEDEARRIAFSHDGNMSRLMEVYSYALPLESQLKEKRAFNYDII